MADEVIARSSSTSPRSTRQPSRGDVDAAALCRALREPAPEDGTRSIRCSTICSTTAFRARSRRSGPGYLAYIPGGGIFPAALADLIADTTNRFTGIWLAAPALVQLEANALDWLRDWMGFPPTTRGLFTTGGSMATFNAILCARERHLGADIRRGVLYTSDQAHHSVKKSAQARRHHARPRPRDPRPTIEFRLRVDALARRDRRGSARRACRPSSSSRTPARRTPARSIRSTPSPTSARARACGTTSTAPTARSSTCATSCGRCSPGCRAPIR